MPVLLLLDPALLVADGVPVLLAEAPELLLFELPVLEVGRLTITPVTVPTG